MSQLRVVNNKILCLIKNEIKNKNHIFLKGKVDT